MKKATIITIIIFLLITSNSKAQSDPPSFDDQVLDTPIDGGLSLLVAAGVGYGAKRLRRRSSIIKID